MENIKKILIIRFSSFGDIVQNMSVITPLAKKYPNAEIHWLTKREFSDLLSSEKRISKILEFEKEKGLFGLIRLALSLAAQKYDVVYDAHNNLRSKIVSIILRFFGSGHLFISRPKDRIKRILLFHFGINKFTWPFKGMLSYLLPLRAIKIEENSRLAQDWSFTKEVDDKITELIPSFNKKIILAPSAAHEMKRWPIEHWKKLVLLLPDFHFILLGGPQDDFCEEIALVDHGRVQNLAGKLSLVESCKVISRGDFFISGDTGLLHVADILCRAGVALIGPSAFGFPSCQEIETLTLPLDCRPCSKDGSGACTNSIYQRCMVEILPEVVAGKVESFYEK